MSDNDSPERDSGSGSTNDAEPAQVSPSSDYKVRGKKTAVDGTGVQGHNTATSGALHGVEGVTESSENTAAGLLGAATASTGQAYGVTGIAEAPSAQGVVGAAADSVPTLGFGGSPTGVWGYTDRSSDDIDVSAGDGVYGRRQPTRARPTASTARIRHPTGTRSTRTAMRG